MRNKKKCCNKSTVKTLDVLDESIDGGHNNKTERTLWNRLYLLDNPNTTSLYHLQVFNEIYYEVLVIFVHVLSII